MRAQTIDQVIEILDQIIEECIDNQSTMGYFAALYRKVTVRVKLGIANGEFEDGERMERLDVVFANRYIEAYCKYKSEEKVTASWNVALDENSNNGLIVLQHLLLGMNAHINLDLGIAAAQVCPGDQLPQLQNDFNKINEILASLVEEVEQTLSDIWPILKWILKLAGKIDNFLVDFSMKLARDGAWNFATSIAFAEGTSLNEAIEIRDKNVSAVAKKYILIKSGLVSLIFKIVRRGEKSNVASRIRELM